MVISGHIAICFQKASKLRQLKICFSTLYSVPATVMCSGIQWSQKTPPTYESLRFLL